MIHEMLNCQCRKILKNQFACSSQVSNYQTRNSCTLQIIRLRLGSQKRASDYFMLLERIILSYNSCISLFPTSRTQIFAHLVKGNISRTTKCAKINCFRPTNFTCAPRYHFLVFFSEIKYLVIDDFCIAFKLPASTSIQFALGYIKSGQLRVSTFDNWICQHVNW